MLAVLSALISLVACGGGGGGGSSTPQVQVFPFAGSYYGTVVSSSNNSGNMGLTSDSAGNGNFTVQFPGLPALSTLFAPPVSSVNGGTLNVTGKLYISGYDTTCNLSLIANTVDANRVKGNYTLVCPGQSNVSATFDLPRGTYSTAGITRQMTR